MNQSQRQPRTDVTVWLTVATFYGPLAHLSAHPDQPSAEAELVDYLKRNHSYTGGRNPDAIPQCVVNDKDLFDAYVMPWFVPLSPTATAGTNVEQHLRQDGFVVLTFNQAEEQFEAWAYQGPLDFERASPLRFGTGIPLRKALEALNHQLAELIGEQR